ncbi:hypothetical protein BofuT4_P014820.1 [Botrytis cinerea T4]|uniref:Uncharacterized protein n=1 Tax=Botryotinia fuckeliana (strain T4) TaxID=999810 RepID=G2XN98_BOTF4|nr:hypothetical protein BofuT4_P014820.1 [Botrytis cinerea T4]
MSRDPLYLRSINSKSLRISTEISLAPNVIIPLGSLIDSGAAGYGFIDRKVVSELRIPTRPLPYTRYLLLADGKPSDVLSQYALLDIRINDHREIGLFYVTTLSTADPMILGLPWLQRHNPSIDWSAMTLRFTSTYCSRYCCPASTMATTVPDIANTHKITSQETRSETSLYGRSHRRKLREYLVTTSRSIHDPRTHRDPKRSEKPRYHQSQSSARTESIPHSLYQRRSGNPS